IGTSTLAVHRQTATVSDTAIAAKIHQPLDIHRNAAAEAALYHIFAELGPDSLQRTLGEILDLALRRNADGGADLRGAGTPNAIDMGQCDYRVFIVGNVDASN